MALLAGSGRPQMHIAAELGIQPSMLRQWRTTLNEASPRPRPAGSAGAPPASPVASPSDQAAEIARLRRELDRARMERDVLESDRHLRGDAQMTVAFIEQPARTWPVRFMGHVLAVSPSGYDSWRSPPESARLASNRQLLGDVRCLRAEHHRRALLHGSFVDIEMRTLQVGREVVARGSGVDGGRVERIMSEQAGEFDQLARVVAQTAQRKGVAQRVRRHGVGARIDWLASAWWSG